MWPLSTGCPSESTGESFRTRMPASDPLHFCLVGVGVPPGPGSLRGVEPKFRTAALGVPNHGPELLASEKFRICLMRLNTHS